MLVIVAGFVRVEFILPGVTFRAEVTVKSGAEGFGGIGGSRRQSLTALCVCVSEIDGEGRDLSSAHVEVLDRKKKKKETFL